MNDRLLKSVCNFAKVILAGLVLAGFLAACSDQDGGTARPEAKNPSAMQHVAGATPSAGEQGAEPKDAAEAAKAEENGGKGGGASRPTVEYKLGPGDLLQVTVFQQPDLSGKFEVDGNGNLVLPLVGAIHAEGRTQTEVQDQLIESLNKSFLVNPKVTVQILNYRPFYILGEVSKPGSYPYVVGITVRQAVAIAGGYTRRARISPVRVIHSGSTGANAENLVADDPVLPGDTIEIDRRLF